MTAHLALVKVCRERGKDLKRIISYNIKHRPIKVQDLVEEMHKQMAFKESLRKGWRSVIKDKRL